MQATLSTLFTPAQKERLTAAARLRSSCRAYHGAPSTEDVAALSYITGRYGLPGVRLVLTKVDEAFFTGTLLGMGRITGCTAAVAIIASAKEPLARLHAGILSEAFVLEATSRGLGTCWVSGTYRKKLLNIPLRTDEVVLCVIAVGVPAVPLTAPANRRRKPLDRICRGDIRLWPEQLTLAAELVQAAPSAMNMQPWTLYVGEEGAFVVDASDRSQLDAGIALCHVELALTKPHTWHFGMDSNEPMAWAKVK